MANHFSILSTSLSELRKHIFLRKFRVSNWILIHRSNKISPLIKSLLLRSLYWSVEISDIVVQNYSFLECFYHLQTVKTLCKLGVSQNSIDDILENVQGYEDYLARSKFIKECEQDSYFNLIINLSSSDVDFDQLLDELQLFHLRLYKNICNTTETSISEPFVLKIGSTSQ